MQGTMGRGKIEERLIAIFIGKPSWSLCGGKSSHFGRLDLIGLNIYNKSTWDSQLASFELSKVILGSKADEEKKNKRK